jgi:short-subunit dehydrogenase
MTQNIIITGAGGGIGHALSLEYAKFGQHLILCDYDIEKLQFTAKSCEAAGATVETYTFDLGNETEVNRASEEIISKYTIIDRLIFVSGISQRDSALDTNLEVDRKIMEVNYFGHINMTKKLLPSLLKSKNPHIGVTSSISGRFGFHLRSAYAASKFAIHGFYESLRLEHWNDNLKVTIICPGRINTPISLSALTANGKKHGVMDPGQANGMPAETCARKMRKAIEKGRKNALVGNSELLMVYFHKYLPSLFYIIANKTNPK